MLTIFTIFNLFKLYNLIIKFQCKILNVSFFLLIWVDDVYFS